MHFSVPLNNYSGLDPNRFRADELKLFSLNDNKKLPKRNTLHLLLFDSLNFHFLYSWPYTNPHSISFTTWSLGPKPLSFDKDANTAISVPTPITTSLIFFPLWRLGEDNVCCFLVWCIRVHVCFMSVISMHYFNYSRLEIKH